MGWPQQALVAMLDAARTKLLSHPGAGADLLPTNASTRSSPGPTTLAGPRLAPHIGQDATDRQPMMRENAEHSRHGLSPPRWPVTDRRLSHHSLGAGGDRPFRRCQPPCHRTPWGRSKYLRTIVSVVVLNGWAHGTGTAHPRGIARLHAPADERSTHPPSCGRSMPAPTLEKSSRTARLAQLLCTHHPDLPPPLDGVPSDNIHRMFLVATPTNLLRPPQPSGLPGLAAPPSESSRHRHLP